MSKPFHEIRDPIHVFVRLDSNERETLNSRPFQRLRHIHQLALTYLVYPGATHKRFEHSLGVMELAGRVFDVVTNPANITDSVRESLEPLSIQDQRAYWKRVVRMAALCHDLGHLPFSHGAEELLPEAWDHERLSRDIISSDEMKEIWNAVTPPLRPEDVVKLAVGQKKAKDLEFTDWQSILSEIIVGDAFGVDRMDYLLRDSHHVGVAYGKFDHYRLVDTLRILPSSPSGGPSSGSESGSSELALGVEEGGIQSAEALMLARYFMYSQVYFHPVRRIYDKHLIDFLKEWLPGGVFPTELPEHQKLTDNEVTTAFVDAAFDTQKPGHLHARRIVRREHFKQIYERNPTDVGINLEAGNAVLRALGDTFGAEYFRGDSYTQRSGALEFPVRLHNGDIVSSLGYSKVLDHVPVVSVDYVFADRSKFDEAKKWLDKNRSDVIRPGEEASEDG